MSKSTAGEDLASTSSLGKPKENLGGGSSLELQTPSAAILPSSIVPKLIELIHSIAKASQVQKSQSDCGSSDSVLFVAPFDLHNFSLQFQQYLAHNFWPNRSFDRLVEYVTQQNVSFGVMEGLLQHLKLNLQLSFKFFALINISTKCTTKLEALTFALANYKLNNFIADCSNDERKLTLFLEDEVTLCFIGKNYEKICQICESNSAMKKCLDPLLPLFRAHSSPAPNLSRDYAQIFDCLTDLSAIKHASRQEIEAFLDESALEISAKSHICYNSLLMVCNNCPSAENIAIIIYYFATHLKTTINPELSTTFQIEFEAYNSSRFFAFNKDEVLSCISKLSREFPEISRDLFSQFLVLHRTPRTDPFLYSSEQLQFFLNMLSQFKDLVQKFVCHIFEQQWSSCIEDQTRQLSMIYYLTQHSEILRKLPIKGFDFHRERAKNHLLWPKQFFTVLFRLYLQNLNNHLKFSILSILKFIILDSCKNIAGNNLASLMDDIVHITNLIIKDIEGDEVQTNADAIVAKESSSQLSGKKSKLIDLIYWCSQKFVASILCSENLNHATCLLALQQILKNSRQFEFSIFSGILQYLNYSTKIPNKTLSNLNSIRLSCQLFDKIFIQRNAAEKSAKSESNSSLMQLKYLFIDSLPKPFMYMIGLFIFSKDLDSIEQLLKFQYECYGSSSICDLLEFLSNELQISEELETLTSESKDVDPCQPNIDHKAQTSELFEGKDNSNDAETPKTIKVRSDVIGAAVFKKILTFLSDYLTDIEDEKIRFQISDFLSKSNAYIFSDATNLKKTTSISNHLFESQNIIDLRQLLDSIFNDNESYPESSGNKQATSQIGADHSDKSSDRSNKFANAFFDRYYSILERIESSHGKACDIDKQFDRSVLMHCLHEASLIFIITKSQFSLLHSSQSVLKKIVTILNKFMLHSKKDVDKRKSDATSSSGITQENNSNIQYLLDFIKHCFTQNVPLSLLVFASLILLSDLTILKRNIENLSIFEFVINSQNFTLLESNIQKLIIDEYNESRKKNKSNSTSSQLDENIDEKLNKKAVCKSLEAKIDPKFIFTVQFIFNNLTLGNLGKKVEEFDSKLLDLPLKQDIAGKKSAIDEGHDESNKEIKSTEPSEILDCLSSRILWLAIYLVRHRASEEPDCQHLYLNFIFASKMSAKLEQECKKQAIEFIHQCLSCNRIFFDSVVKRRFENIGQFLSQITLQRNIPILQSNLALDALLHECNLKGIQEVEIVIPFVIKIIEPCIDKTQTNQGPDSLKSKNDNQILMMLFGGHASNDSSSQLKSDTFCYEQQKKSIMSEVFENEFPSMSSAGASREIKSEKMTQGTNSEKKATLIDSDVSESAIPCIFDLPNPWTYSILSMVAEIYHYYQKLMKVALQTQIEKFFKSIPVDFNELQLLQILTTVPFLEKQLYLPSKYLNIKSLALSHQRFTNAYGSRSNSNEGLSGTYVNQNLAPKPSQPLKSLHFVKQQSVMPDYSLLLSLQRYNNEFPQTNGNFVVNNDAIFGDNSEQNKLKYNKLLKMLVVPHQSAAFQALIQFSGNSSHNQSSSGGKSNLNEVIIESMVKGVQSIVYPICVKTQNTVMTTCLMMAYKDFFQINSITDSGDDFLVTSDVTNIRNQVAELVRYLSASLALITCEEGVIPSLALCLKSALLRQFAITSSAQRHQIECGIMAIIHKNFLIVTKFIQESVVESCLKELDNFFYSFFTPKMQSQLFQNRHNEKSSDTTKLNATNNSSQNELLTHLYLSFTAPTTNMAVTYEKDDNFASKLHNNSAIGLSSEQGINSAYKQCSKLSSQMYRKVYVNMANNSKDDPNVTHSSIAGQSQSKLTSELDSEINMTGTFSDSQVQGTAQNPRECSRVIYERVKDLISKLQAAFPSLSISNAAYETPINSPHNLTRSEEFSLSKNVSSANSAKKHPNNSIFSSDGASNVILLSTAIDKFFQANQCEEMAVALCQRAINCLLERVPSANIHRTYQTSIIKILKLLSNPQLIYPINSATILLAIKRIPDSRCLDFHFIDLILRNKLITPKHFDELIMHYFDMRILTHVEFLLGLLKRILIDMPIDGLVFQRDFRATQNILMKFAAADPQRRSDSIKAVLAQLLKKPAAPNQKSAIPTLNPQANNSHEDLGQNVNSSNMVIGNKTLPLSGSTLSALLTQQPIQSASINDNDTLGGGNQSAGTSHGPNKDFSATNFSKGKMPDEVIESLLREWIHMFQSQDALRNQSILNSTYHLQNLSKFIGKLNRQGMLKSDSLMSYFFQTSIELCIKDATSKLAAENIGRHNDGIAIPVDRSLRNVVKDKCFYVLDALVGLIILLIKYSGERLTVIKVSMLHRIMRLIVNCLSKDSLNFTQKLKSISINKDQRNFPADISSSTFQNYGNSMAYKNAYFHPLPYYRMMYMIFFNLNMPDSVFDSINIFLLMTYSDSLLSMPPRSVPAFAFYYLELIGNPLFIEKMLDVGTESRDKCWNMYSRLLNEVFKFVSKIMSCQRTVNASVLTFYKALLRLLLIMLHDFPDFICDYYYTFCDNISLNCLQLRNLILSAFPRSINLPCPYESNRYEEFLANMTHVPNIVHSYSKILQENKIIPDLEDFLNAKLFDETLPNSQNLKMKYFADLLKIICSSIPSTSSKLNASSYNLPLMNALVIYIAHHAISKQILPKIDKNTPQQACINLISSLRHSELFAYLLSNLDDQGKYLMLGSMVNHLRYPNPHTFYFSQTILYLFLKLNSVTIKEIITRILLERFTVSRPHPWGLLVTFIELLRKPIYNLWSYEFVSYTPEIRKLFEWIAHTPIINQHPDSTTTTTTTTNKSSPHQTVLPSKGN